MIRFQCPGCNGSLKINDSLAGRKCACPKCGQRLDVPATPPVNSLQSSSVAGPRSTPQTTPASDAKELARSMPPTSSKTLPFPSLSSIPRRYLTVAAVGLGLLFVLGLFWFTFSQNSPSKVLISTIMKAHAGGYSAVEESLLPDGTAFLHTRGGIQMVCDNISKNGTVKKVTILEEKIRGEGATVRFSIEYNDGTSTQNQVALSKIDGKWKVSLMGLAMMRMGRLPPTNQNYSVLRPDPHDPFGSATSRVLPATSSPRSVIRAPAVAKKPAAPQSEPALQRNGDEYKLAMEKLGEFQTAGDDPTRSRIALELADMSGRWTKDESSQVIDAVAKLGAAGKPLARLLCAIIANGVLTPHMVRTDPLRRKALAALENVHPDLYSPVIVITIDQPQSLHSVGVATKRLAELADASVAPILLKHLRDAAKKDPFSYFGELPGYMQALVKVAPDDPATFEAIWAFAKTWASGKARNFRGDNLPVAVAAVKIMGTLGSKAKEAIPTLTQLKLDENETMRQAASNALKEIDGKE